VVRTRGQIWLATRPDATLWLESACGGLQIGYAGDWLAAGAWQHADPERRALASLRWHDRWGYRAQELAILVHDTDPDDIAAVPGTSWRSCRLGSVLVVVAFVGGVTVPVVQVVDVIAVWHCDVPAALAVGVGVTVVGGVLAVLAFVPVAVVAPVQVSVVDVVDVVGVRHGDMAAALAVVVGVLVVGQVLGGGHGAPHVLR
jgi:hypothetical protein